MRYSISNAIPHNPKSKKHPYENLVNVDLSAFDHVTVCSPIWVFNLAAPVRAFFHAASGKIKKVDYILVHHTNGRYENAADEMDSLLGIKRTSLRSFSCKTGKYKEIK